MSLSFYVISSQCEFFNRKKKLCQGRTHWSSVFSSDTTSTDHCARTYFWCVVFAPFNISFLPFCDSNNTESFLTIQFWTKTIKKARTELSKHREKKMIQKNWNGQILSTFWPYIFWLKQLKTVQISHSFFNYVLLIFQICTV